MVRVSGKIWACLLLIGVLFVVLGCTGFYEGIGFTPAQAIEQVAQDKAAFQEAIGQGRVLTWQLISAALGGVGTIATVLLGKWLKTERTISSVVIQGVEKADKGEVKAAIFNKATSAGIEPKLNKRVNKLT